MSARAHLLQGAVEGQRAQPVPGRPAGLRRRAVAVAVARERREHERPAGQEDGKGGGGLGAAVQRCSWGLSRGKTGEHATASQQVIPHVPRSQRALAQATRVRTSRPAAAPAHLPSMTAMAAAE